VFKTLGCKSLARVDVIVKNDDIYVLEVNTLPGFTTTSLFPKAAKAEGIDFQILLARLLNSQVKKNDE
jgi:D-alanine-D-alanine ligase